jgi:hypothetical protein
MPLIQVIVTLIVVGILLWLVNRFIPMAGSIKSILNAVVVIVVVLWLLNVFGLLSYLSNLRVGKYEFPSSYPLGAGPPTTGPFSI